MTGIICAMEKEVRNIMEKMTVTERRVYAGKEYVSGKLNGRDAVVAVCGIGKVHAAMCAQTMILEFKPDEIINVGVAGALTSDLKVFDVVVARDLVQHDFDFSALGDPPGLIQGVGRELAASPRIVAALEEVISDTGINHVVGRIASGDIFVDAEDKRRSIADTFGAVACEMEGAAVAQVCKVNGVDFAVLRAISDSGEGDYAVFAEKAAENSARIICEYMRRPL